MKSLEPSPYFRHTHINAFVLVPGERTYTYFSPTRKLIIASLHLFHINTPFRFVVRQNRIWRSIVDGMSWRCCTRAHSHKHTYTRLSESCVSDSANDSTDICVEIHFAEIYTEASSSRSLRFSMEFSWIFFVNFIPIQNQMDANAISIIFLAKIN